MKRPTIDQSAATTGAVLALLGVFNVAAFLGISGDDLAIAVGAIATLAGVLRHRLESRRWSPSPDPVADANTAEILT